MTFTDTQLLERYRSAQNVPQDAPLTIEQVQQHWRLEQELTQGLLQAPPEDRWAVFDEAYTRLYEELPWLQSHGEDAGDHFEDLRFGEFASVLGGGPLDIYEIGSGQGKLMRYLAARGHRCKGTEITRQRGAGVPGIAWGNSDGVHLDRFEAYGSYDVLISSQVVEHLHPDDVTTHFAGARALLRPGGRYVFDTPHRLHGPADVSDVFGYEISAGMHLKEYTFREMRSALAAAGFRRVEVVIRLPLRVQLKLPVRVKPVRSAAFLSYLEVLERLLALVPGHRRRRKAARLAALLGFQTIFLVAYR